MDELQVICLSQELELERLKSKEFLAVWRTVKTEEFTAEDWIDLHTTIQQFKGRVVARHRGGADK